MKSLAQNNNRGNHFQPNSLQNLWTVFLDKNANDVVAIDGSNPDQLSVNGGRHRLGLARKLGMTSFPCKTYWMA